MCRSVDYAVLVLFFAVCCLGCNGQTGGDRSSDVEPIAEIQSPSKDAGEIATLEIDFQSSRQNIVFELPCEDESTVFGLLKQANERGELEFESTGRDAMVFVNSIGGVDNQSASGDNWVFRVNGDLGDRSCGVFFVKPGDHVLWVFGAYP